VIIQAAVKSGTNQIHGSAFMFYRDSVPWVSESELLLAHGTRSKASTATSVWRYPRRAHLEGPHLLLRRLLTALRQTLPNSGLTINTVPTVKMRTGDFSELLGSSQTVVPALYSGPGSYSPTAVRPSPRYTVSC
jgi:hypothetical protein